MSGFKNKILVVGQTPPPYGGQAIMIQNMLDHKFDEIEFFHVRMNFSREISDFGKISLHKITHIFSIIKQAYVLKFKHKIKVLYYPTSNASKVAILRDVVFLLSTRFLFKKVIFHFHAAGLSEEVPKLNPLFKMMALMALRKPDLTIALSEYNPPDGKFLAAKKNVIIPYGIRDDYAAGNTIAEIKTAEPLNILFVGLLDSTKGEGYLLSAAHKLHQSGFKVRVRIAGKFESESYKEAFFNQINEYQLNDYVEYLGVITGKDKINAYASADIFCFPSFFISESFGVVLLEAMQFELPVVATRWRGIQSIVEDGNNGYLVDIKDADQLAEKIRILITEPELRKSMGRNSRKLFIQKYSLEKYMSNLNESFLELID